MTISFPGMWLAGSYASGDRLTTAAIGMRASVVGDGNAAPALGTTPLSLGQVPPFGAGAEKGALRESRFKGIVTLTEWCWFSWRGSGRHERRSYVARRFPVVVVQHAAWLCFRFSLSYRDVEDLLPERGVDVSYETARRWTLKFGPAYAAGLRRRRPRPSDRWRPDEVLEPVREAAEKG